MKAKRDMIDILAELPATCAARHPTDESPILIQRGESGYIPLSRGFNVERYNERHGHNAAIVEAMLVGSMFGWHVPGADPRNYRHDGSPKP
jgi:hypothetical protein